MIKEFQKLVCAILSKWCDTCGCNEKKPAKRGRPKKK
tara:strand:- start:195 stop:305 length:111 start_codon:yes stop_codon:yes gene_type:complete